VANNHHATLVILQNKGVLIRGASGSGKSSLALALLDHATSRGWFARLVADDQVYLRAAHNRLLAQAPQAIAGLIELPPLGPVPIGHEARAVVDWVVDLVASETVPRMSEPAKIWIDGVALPHLLLPQRSTARSLQALHQSLFNKDLPGTLPL